jgi:hypothetical protein
MYHSAQRNIVSIPEAWKYTLTSSISIFDIELSITILSPLSFGKKIVAHYTDLLQRKMQISNFDKKMGEYLAFHVRKSISV